MPWYRLAPVPCFDRPRRVARLVPQGQAVSTTAQIHKPDANVASLDPARAEQPLLSQANHHDRSPPFPVSETMNPVPPPLRPSSRVEKQGKAIIYDINHKDAIAAITKGGAMRLSTNRLGNPASIFPTLNRSFCFVVFAHGQLGAMLLIHRSDHLDFVPLSVWVNQVEIRSYLAFIL